MRQKGFAYLPILIIIVLIGALGYFVNQNNQLITLTPNNPPSTYSPSTSPTSNPTVGWKTYKNDKYNFEIQYPQNWQYDSRNPLAVQFEESNPEEFSEETAITFNILSKYQDLDSFKLERSRSGRKVEIEENVLINGISATKLVEIIESNTPTSYTYYVFIDRNNTSYFFQENVRSEIHNQIISSLKFRK